MAYSKKTWKARQGLGLNKFSIDGATPVAIINQPDSVTQQGDALSAGNLNDLEDRIANAFDDVENEKADKATTDDLQSQIVNLNTDVATLDAIVGGEAEIDNVDPSEGQSILASSRLIHHVNLLPSGEFGLVGARDIVHEGSIVNLNPTGFSIRGVNLWDEVTEVGMYDTTTGLPDTGNQLRSKTLVAVSPSTEYYVKTPYIMWFFFYDIDGNLITSGLPSGGETASNARGFVNQSFITPSNCSHIKFYMVQSYGTTYNHDIQICDNSIPSAVKTVYHPYSEQTVPVSISGHYVNENVYDYVTNKTVNGVLRGEVHTRVGVVDLGSLTWTKSDNGNYFYADLPTSSVTGSFALCAKYVNVSSGQAMYTGTEDKVVGVALNYISGRTDRVYIRDSTYADATIFKASLSGVTLYYELATEVVTYGEPLRSFSLTDYATVEPITPQTLPNRVDVPFSVLSKSNNGLIEQIRQNTADIADNKAILSQHEARISNLEQISGEYVASDLQDYSTVPTGKASYALVETMKGVSRVDNQLALAFNDTNWQFNNATGSFSDGVATFTATATRGNVGMKSSADTRTLPSVAGRVVLISVKVKTTTATTSVKLYTYGGYANKNCEATTNWQTISLLANTDASWGYDLTNNNRATVEDGRSGSWDAVQVKDWVVTDLTLYFNGGTIPTLAEIQSMYPELLEPRAYNAGEIVDSTYTKVTSVGVNLWDEEWELGDINGSTGQDSPSTTSIRSVGYTEVPYGEVLFVHSPTTRIIVYSYDTDKNFIAYQTANNNVAINLPSGTRYIRFNQNSTSYNHDIQICLNSYADKTTYHPYMTDSLTIPTVTLKGAGSVSDELDVESGEITRRAVAIDLGDLTWENYNDTNGIFRCIVSGVINRYGSSSSVAEMTCARYIPDTANRVSSGNTNGTIGLNGGGSTLYVYDSSYAKDASVFKTGVTGIKVILELATPTTESVTPTLDNTLKTEGGGSVHSDADVDGHFTMGFINL